VASDEDLIERLQAGDEAAFGELVDRYHVRLVRLAQSVVGSRETAEDVAQETWVAVLRGVDRFEGRSMLRTWLFRVCVNRARSTGTRERRSTPIDTGEPAVDPRRFSSTGHWSTPPEDWSGAVDDRLVASGLASHVKGAIDGLPDIQRQVVTLRDVEGLSSKEVCEVLSISAVNERVLLHRGRSRVRSLFEQQLRGG
jgi:RNA polymerase sigma-70 factor (ECF subfamily)